MSLVADIRVARCSYRGGVQDAPRAVLRMKHASLRIESQGKGGEILDSEILRKMSQADIRTVKPEELVDITGIEIDRKQPAAKRIKSYVEQVHNPYLVRVGDYTVKTEYSDCEETLNDRMMQYISKMAELTADTDTVSCGNKGSEEAE